jgi:hypothetical protein
MSRRILLAVASAVTAGLLAVLVTAMRLATGESAVGADSPAAARVDQRAADATARTQEATVSQSRPVLVLLPEASASEQVGRLQSAYRVLTLMRPRLAVVEVDEQALTALRKTPDVVGVYEQNVPPDVLAGLRPEERLFVEGWILQQASKDKSRSGDGLSWDAPGFQPPGPPVKKHP